MKKLIWSSLSLCLSLGVGIGGAQAACGLESPSQLGKLPFIGAAVGTEYGFAFDNEHYSAQVGFPFGGSLANMRESSLMIATFDPTTGAFAGTMNGPWAGALPVGVPVAGTIGHANNSNFSIQFSYSAPVLPAGTPANWEFTGSFRTFVLPAKATRACSLAMQIAGTYTHTVPSGQQFSSFGPSPFSGAAFTMAIP